MQVEQISHAILRSLVPLSHLSDEQLDLLMEHAQLTSLYQGQVLVNVGDANQHHLYLLNGKLNVMDKGFNASMRIVDAGDDESFVPIAADHPRQDKVVAHTDCQVLKIDSDFLERIFCWGSVSRALLAEVAVDEKYQNDYLWIKKLLESRLFYKVPPTNIYSILNRFKSMPVKSGDTIITQGEEGSCCYLIRSGNADVFVKEAGDKAVANLSTGTVFGEDALVTQNERNATVVMSSDGELMKLEKVDFYQLLKQPEVTLVTAGNVNAFVQTGSVLLDVRTQSEFDRHHIPGALNMPLHLCYLKSAILDKSVQYICYAATEDRARAAAFLLAEQGFRMHVLQGGLSSLLDHASSA